MFAGEGLHHLVVLALCVSFDRCYLILKQLFRLLNLRVTTTVVVVLLLFSLLLQLRVSLRRIVKIKLVC